MNLRNACFALVALVVPACASMPHAAEEEPSRSSADPPSPQGVQVITCSDTAKCYDEASALCKRGYSLVSSSKTLKAWRGVVTELVVTCNAPDAPGVAPPVAERQDTRVCEAAFKEMPQFAGYWVKHSPNGKALDELPEQRDFVTTCQSMPENVQRCVHSGYRNVHAKACDAVLSRLNAIQRSRFDALFLEAPGAPSSSDAGASSGPTLAL